MLKKVLTSACVIFTVLVGGYSMINLILYSSDPSSYLALSSLRVFLFFPFALILAFANRIFDVKGMDSWLKVALHFIVTMLDAYLCLVLPIGSDMAPSAMLVGMFMFLVLYAAILAVMGLCRAKKKSEDNAKQDYTPVYAKKLDKK